MSKKRRRARHCSKCGSTAHDVRYHAKRRRTRKNPVIGKLRAIEYDRYGDPGPSYRHEAGDTGLGKGEPDELYVNPRTGKLTLRGAMRWTRRGLVG